MNLDSAGSTACATKLSEQYWGWARKNRRLDWLDKNYTDRSWYMVFSWWTRNFQDLMRRVGF